MSKWFMQREILTNLRIVTKVYLIFQGDIFVFWMRKVKANVETLGEFVKELTMKRVSRILCLEILFVK